MSRASTFAAPDEVGPILDGCGTGTVVADVSEH
jgi:hypothetical protein